MLTRTLLFCMLPLCLITSLAAQDEYPQGTALLGVMLHPVPLDVLETVGLSPGQGTMVTRVWPGTAADAMGLQPGDVIINVNGTDTDSRRDVRTTVISHNSGDEATIQILRNGTQPITLTGTFSEMPTWLEDRIKHYIPRMTENWEDRVADHQRSILAQRNQELEGIEQQISELEARQKSGTSVPLLPVIEFKSAPPLEMQASNESWHFQYSWMLSQKGPQCASSSLLQF